MCVCLCVCVCEQSDSNLADDEKAEKEFGLKRKYTVREKEESHREIQCTYYVLNLSNI